MDDKPKYVGFGRYKGLTYERLWDLDRHYCHWFHNAGKTKLWGSEAEAFWKWLHAKIVDQRYKQT